jgi:hypothetical protein
VSVVEFATIVASISLLATSLSGLQASIAEKLSGSDAVAVQQAVAGARRAGAPPTGARSAYAHSPYKKPALRYVYATGWVAGTKHRAGCALASLDVDSTISLTIKAIRANASAMRKLRRLHLTAVQAGHAFARGFVSACS